jgi:hypothetical protein
MRSEFAEWLDQMQHIADSDNIIVAARHYDWLCFQFETKETPTEAYHNYRHFLKRWNAITKNGLFTEATP